MSVNSIKNISKVIYLLDKQILINLNKNEVDYRRLSTLTDIRILYIEEMNNFIRSKNTGDMFDKKYWKSYRKNKI